jgi:hypothetical protein
MIRPLLPHRSTRVLLASVCVDNNTLPCISTVAGFAVDTVPGYDRNFPYNPNGLFFSMMQSSYNRSSWCFELAVTDVFGGDASMQ